MNMHTYKNSKHLEYHMKFQQRSCCNPHPTIRRSTPRHSNLILLKCQMNQIPVLCASKTCPTTDGFNESKEIREQKKKTTKISRSGLYHTRPCGAVVWQCMHRKVFGVEMPTSPHSCLQQDRGNSHIKRWSMTITKMSPMRDHTT